MKNEFDSRNPGIVLPVGNGGKLTAESLCGFELE